MRFGIWELVIILLIVVFLFGTKRIRGLGTDLGDAIKSFRSAVREEKDESSDQASAEEQDTSARVIEGEVKSTTQSEHSKQTS